MTASARSASAGPMATPKNTTSTVPTMPNIQTAHTTWLTTGPKMMTSREAGVMNTASSVPRTWSVRSAVPGPHRIMLIHM